MFDRAARLCSGLPVDLHTNADELGLEYTFKERHLCYSFPLCSCLVSCVLERSSSSHFDVFIYCRESTNLKVDALRSTYAPINE